MMPLDNTGRDSNGDLMASYKKVLESESQEKKLTNLSDFTFGFAASSIKRLRALRARLPFPPWLIKIVTGIGFTVVLGAEVWLVRMDARANSAYETATEAKTATDKLDDRLRPIEQGVVKLNADMENLLDVRGVQPSTREHRRRTARDLGLPVDSTATDSSGL